MTTCPICGQPVADDQAAIRDCNQQLIHLVCDIAVLDDVHDDDFFEGQRK